MATIEAAGPNAQQIEYWNEISGARWVEMNDVIDAQLVPLGEAALARAEVSEGLRVLDIGCGCGQTTLQLAEKVGPKGEVVGLDISEVMLDRARERAEAAGLGNIRFLNADAQTFAFEDPQTSEKDSGLGGFDLIFSRFGVMFFASPEAAFENLLKALRPGGRLVCVTWQPLPLNDWMFIPLQAIAGLLPPMESPPDPTAPGPFALADSERFEGILAAAGFADPKHESLQRELLVAGGRSLDETAVFVSKLGPGGAALREANAAKKAEVVDAIRTALIPYSDGTGVRMRAAAWIVTAARPV